MLHPVEVAPFEREDEQAVVCSQFAFRGQIETVPVNLVENPAILTRPLYRQQPHRLRLIVHLKEIEKQIFRTHRYRVARLPLRPAGNNFYQD